MLRTRIAAAVALATVAVGGVAVAAGAGGNDASHDGAPHADGQPSGPLVSCAPGVHILTETVTWPADIKAGDGASDEAAIDVARSIVEHLGVTSPSNFTVDRVEGGHVLVLGTIDDGSTVFATELTPGEGRWLTEISEACNR